MKKELLLILAIFSLHLNSTAQHTKQRHLVSLAPGVSIPIGRFGGNSSFSNADAFAKPGPALAVQYSYHFNNNWALTAGLNTQINGLDTRAIADAFARELYIPRFFTSTSPGFPPPSPGHRYDNWDVKKKSWVVAALLLGAEYRQPLGKTGNSYWTTNASVGIVHISMPALSGETVTDTSSAFIEQEKGAGLGAAFSIGTGFQFRLSKAWSLQPSIKWIATNAVSFGKTKATITETRGQPGLAGYSISQSTYTGTLSQKISSIQFSLGLAYSF